MNKYNAYKYVINVKESISSTELLDLFSASKEDGILKVKAIQGKSRVIIYALEKDFSFGKYGDLVGDIENLTYYELSEYDNFELKLKNELYDMSNEFCLSAWIENNQSNV